MIVNDIRKSKYERQLRELEPYTISTVDPNDELEWMNRGMYELLKFMYDNEQYMDVVDDNGAGLTVMEGGEHWFHTKEQMRFLDRWMQELCDE